MSEVKRISLKTVSNNNNNNLDKSENNKKNKDNNNANDNKEPKTKRFVLELNTSGDECSEFSFNALIKSNNDKNGEQVNGLNASEDQLADINEENKLRQLEKEFQEKYGPKKKSQWEDYIDKGMGYDETDPFIDNEEAYDELVPSTLTTRYGGFYINCGELEFRSADENDEEEDNIRPVIKRKRKLDLSDSAKRRRSSTEKSKKSNNINNNNNNKIPSPGKTVAQMLQQKKAQQTNPNDNSDGIEEIEIIDTDSSEELIVSASVRDVVDSVAKGDGQPNGEERNGSAGSSDEDLIKKDNSISVVKLPDGLPTDLITIIDKIKKLAQTSHDGKRNFFNSDVNNMLLQIETISRELQSSQRTLIYSHLASYLPCTKQTLITRAKKALFESIEYKLQTAIAEIATNVKKIEPDLMKRYRDLCEELQLQYVRNKQNGLISSQTEPKSPRKIFPWNERLKELLTESLRSKIQLYEQLGAKNQSISLKDYLFEFLDKEIKPIWPKGWMSLEILKHRAKWIREILPQVHTSQPSIQTVPQITTSTPIHSLPQTLLSDKANKVQTQQQLLSEKVVKVQQLIVDKTNKSVINNSNNINNKNNECIELIEVKQLSNTAKQPLNTAMKSHLSPYIKMNDHLSEGLVSKFIPAVKEVKDNVNNSDAINLSTIDLSTKARSSPKPLTLPSVRTSPINLKTSPNITVVKSNSPSPSVSPLAMTSILQTKNEKLSRDACLQKVIEQTLGDYPNSSIQSHSIQRNSKPTHSSLPLTSLPIAEMLSKSFNSNPNKDANKEICIEIASSPEPFKKVQQYQHQTHQTQQKQMQNKSVNKQPSAPNLTSNANQLNFHRNSDLPKKKAILNNLIHSPTNTNHNKEFGQSVVEMNQLLLQSQINRNLSRDTSISITPIPQKTIETNTTGNINTVKHHSNQNSRYNNSTNVISSTTSTPMNLSREKLDQLSFYQMYMCSPNIMQNNAALNHLLSNSQHFQNSHLFPSTSNSSNRNVYYPFSTTTTTTTPTTHPTGEGRGRTSN